MRKYMKMETKETEFEMPTLQDYIFFKKIYDEIYCIDEKLRPIFMERFIVNMCYADVIAADEAERENLRNHIVSSIKKSREAFLASYKSK